MGDLSIAPYGPALPWLSGAALISLATLKIQAAATTRTPTPGMLQARRMPLTREPLILQFGLRVRWWCGVALTALAIVLTPGADTIPMRIAGRPRACSARLMSDQRRPPCGQGARCWSGAAVVTSEISTAAVDTTQVRTVGQASGIRPSDEFPTAPCGPVVR